MTTEPDGFSHHIDGLETRRTAIGRAAFVPLGIAVGLVDADTRAALATVPPAAARDWETFLKRAVPAAKAALEAGSIDHYLYTVAAHAGDLDDVPEPAFRRFGTYDPPVELGMVHRGAPFFVIHWRLAPRAFLPAHCHPKASVCTVGLAGEARLRNFEIEGDAPDFRVDSATEFRIRESKREWIAKGRINTLSPTRRQ